MKIDNAKLLKDYILFKQAIERKLYRIVQHNEIFKQMGVNKMCMWRIFHSDDGISLRNLKKITAVIGTVPEDYIVK